MSEHAQPVRLTSEEWHDLAEFIENLNRTLKGTFGENEPTVRMMDERMTMAAAGLHYLAESDPEGCVFTVEEQPKRARDEIEEDEESWEI